MNSMRLKTMPDVLSQMGMGPVTLLAEKRASLETPDRLLSLVAALRYTSGVATTHVGTRSGRWL